MKMRLIFVEILDCVVNILTYLFILHFDLQFIGENLNPNLTVSTFEGKQLQMLKSLVLPSRSSGLQFHAMSADAQAAGPNALAALMEAPVSGPLK